MRPGLFRAYNYDHDAATSEGRLNPIADIGSGLTMNLR